MNLTGEKVILRTMEDQDRELFLRLIRDPETVKITGGYPSSVSCDHQMDWFGAPPDSAGNVRRIIADREHPKDGLGIIVLSNVDLKNKTGEIYIKLVKSARRKGYGEEAVKVFVSYGFRELRLTHIYSHILEHNAASRRLFEKCGFRLESISKSSLHKDSGERNVCSYVMKDMSKNSYASKA